MTAIARAAGVTRQTVYRWANEKESKEMTDYNNYIIHCPGNRGEKPWTGTVAEFIRWTPRVYDSETLREIAAECGRLDMDRFNSEDDLVREAEENRYFDGLPELLATNLDALRSIADDRQATVSPPR